MTVGAQVHEPFHDAARGITRAESDDSHLLGTAAAIVSVGSPGDPATPCDLGARVRRHRESTWLFQPSSFLLRGAGRGHPAE